MKKGSLYMLSVLVKGVHVARQPNESKHAGLVGV